MCIARRFTSSGLRGHGEVAFIGAKKYLCMDTEVSSKVLLLLLWS